MGAIETTILIVVALVLGWGAVEIACKPCMESGRAAINRSLDPDYDPDDAIANTPYVEAPRSVENQEEPDFPESPKKSYKVVKGRLQTPEKYLSYYLSKEYLALLCKEP